MRPDSIITAVQEKNPGREVTIVQQADGRRYIIFDDEPDKRVPVPPSIIARAEEIEATPPPPPPLDPMDIILAELKARGAAQTIAFTALLDERNIE